MPRTTYTVTNFDCDLKTIFGRRNAFPAKNPVLMITQNKQK